MRLKFKKRTETYVTQMTVSDVMERGRLWVCGCIRYTEFRTLKVTILTLRLSTQSLDEIVIMITLVCIIRIWEGSTDENYYYEGTYLYKTIFMK